MPVLLFPDLERLRLALASGAVPANVSRAPARVRFDQTGQLRLSPIVPLGRDELTALVRLGVSTQDGASAVGEIVADWFRLLPLLPAPLLPAGPTVLFEMPGELLPRVAGEVRRLTGQAVAFRWLEIPGLDAPPSPQRRFAESEKPLPLATEDDFPSASAAPHERSRVLVQIAAPPFAVLARALGPADEAPPIRAFYEQSKNVWVALGFAHPLAEMLQPPEGFRLVLQPDRDWGFLADAPFLDGPGDFDIPSAAVAFRATPGSARIPVPMRLERDPSALAQPSELWLLGARPLAQLRDWLQDVDERWPARFESAVANVADRGLIVLRARPSKQSPPPLVLPDATGYCSWLHLPNLFLPCGWRLRPPIRRDRIRSLLAPDPNRLTWLRPGPDGSWARETLPMFAFRPLAGIVSYRCPRRPTVQTTWQANLNWRPASFAVREDVPTVSRPAPPSRPVGTAAASASPPTAEASGILGKVVQTLRQWLKSTPSNESRPVVRQSERESLDLPPHSTRDELVQLQQRLEDRLRATAPPLKTAQRLALWPRLATVYAELGHYPDAAACWLHALWDREVPTLPLVIGWRRAEAKGRRWSVAEQDVDHWLSPSTAPGGVRGVAAFVVWASLQEPPPPALLARLADVQREVTAHEAELPVRAVWLVRLALARLTGGDVLALARARDGLLERLYHKGLSLNQDVPRFLRFAGPHAGEHSRKIAAWLRHKLRPLLRRWIKGIGADSVGLIKLQEVGLVPETRYTRRYVDLILAWGLARLGETSDAAELTAEAAPVLESGDEVHGLLLAAFRHRIAQAGEGQAGPDSLPPKLFARIERLGALERYCVDRLRERSRILEPTACVNPFRGSVYIRYTSFQELDQFLNELPDRPRAQQALQLRAWLARTRPGGGEHHLKVVRAALEQAPLLGETFAHEALETVAPALPRARAGVAVQAEVLERALFVAAYFADSTATARLVNDYAALLDGPHGLEASFEPLAEQCFRSLRRLGLADQIRALLKRATAWLRQHNPSELKRRRPDLYPVSLRTALHVAGAWFYLGREAKAIEFLDAARAELLTERSLPPPEQTALARTYATTLGQAPIRLAEGRLEELFQLLQGVTVRGTANSHYNPTALELVEAVVRAVVHEDFLLTPALRRWRDDDEFLVRQRIRRDLEALLAEG